MKGMDSTLLKSRPGKVGAGPWKDESAIMPSAMSALERVMTCLGIGNIAIAAASLLMPLILAIGFLTDRNELPGHGISARGGLQAAIQQAIPSHRG